MTTWTDPRSAEAQTTDTMSYGIHEMCGTPLTVTRRKDGNCEVSILACPRCGGIAAASDQERSDMDGHECGADCWSDDDGAHHAEPLARLAAVERERDEAVTSLAEARGALPNIAQLIQNWSATERERGQLRAVLAAVEAIHHRATHHAYPEGWCPSCEVRWPCRTGRALAGD